MQLDVYIYIYVMFLLFLFNLRYGSRGLSGLDLNQLLLLSEDVQEGGTTRGYGLWVPAWRLVPAWTLEALEPCLHHRLHKTMNASAKPILTEPSVPLMCVSAVCVCLWDCHYFFGWPNLRMDWALPGLQILMWRPGGWASLGWDTLSSQLRSLQATSQSKPPQKPQLAQPLQAYTVLAFTVAIGFGFWDLMTCQPIIWELCRPGVRTGRQHNLWESTEHVHFAPSVTADALESLQNLEVLLCLTFGFLKRSEDHLTIPVMSNQIVSQ